MHCAYRRLKILSVEPHESQGWLAAGLDDQQVSCSESLDVGERSLANGITRAEVMEYLSQTYGQTFTADLGKHLSWPT